ncbi:hypothetical protein J4O15_11150 [Lachnoanaerobaculum sp. Marseille-Q4761]|jgi:hypothetical protein|uniref:hypothetical protein n=1 Tax=Lachnoanaerobaculum sp. Marseille-Q4761 TaxID=2819511 RepID=UPI001AA17427|nr:hypothetical protein [Lachnoanaerobaculum sp. Marseille-Q4761]MBO1871473.1 hypothetical protein [Lachnoanaerobaculum sp. Marseille-Q4761]
MRGLRTNEGAKFEKYFYIVQEEAKKLGGVFFSETGEGRDLDLEDIEVCDLGGWLVPFDQADEFEALYLGRKDKEIWDKERWDNMYIFVDYMFDGNSVSVKFDKYEYDTQIFEGYETQKEAGTLKTRPIEELWKELNIPE